MKDDPGEDRRPYMAGKVEPRPVAVIWCKMHKRLKLPGERCQGGLVSRVVIKFVLLAISVGLLLLAFFDHGALYSGFTVQSVKVLFFVLLAAFLFHESMHVKLGKPSSISDPKED